MSGKPQTLLLVALALACLCANCSAIRSQDQVAGRQDEAAINAQIGRQLQQSYASASGTGTNVQTGTQTTGPNGQTTSSGEDLTAPPGGSTTSSVSSYAPTSPGGAKPTPIPVVVASPPPPSPPPPPPCTDVPPPKNGFTCAQQKAFGKCEASWMLLNGWCKTTCGHCPSQPPPPSLSPPPPVFPLPLFPLPLPSPIPFPSLPTPQVTYGSPCDQSDYQSGSGSVSASASCTSYGK
ncbi:hypothetical protein WJX73_000331 [Symbiochloris irregularis]|uniref:ShKT domain-containing protein n=1 Tax=Symbiochloris irregularis TaxID=706552 RepID=A0AAW1P9U9_9CHLO